jgi:hypothetical protein
MKMRVRITIMIRPKTAEREAIRATVTFEPDEVKFDC